MNPIKSNPTLDPSTNTEPVICRFPFNWDDDVHSLDKARFVRVYDYEIFGAFGFREKFIFDLHDQLKKRSGNLEIVTHLKFFAQHPSIKLSESYFEEYRRWQEKLGREVFYESPNQIDRTTIDSIATGIFPQTCFLLGDNLEKLLSEYLQDKELDSVNFHELFRYFPFFLREKTLGHRIALWSDLAWEVARWEWINCELEYTDLISSSTLNSVNKVVSAAGSISKKPKTVKKRDLASLGQTKIQLNPSVFTIRQDRELKILGKTVGVYAMWARSTDFLVQERKLDHQTALILAI